MFVTGCATEEPRELRYAGTMRVTRSTSETGVVSGSVFGKITIPSELAPTASASGCDYFGTRQRAGVTLGSLELAGLATSPLLVEPTSFIDGMLYLAQLGNTQPFGAGDVVDATLHDNTGPVHVQATAPAPLASVVLPPSVSASSGGTITWQPGDGDAITISIAVTGLGTERYLRCATADTGSFTIPAAAVALVEHGPNDGVVLAVSRRNSGQSSSDPADLVLDLELASEVFGAVTLAP